MGEWAAFAGLTAILLASLLALARLSQEAVGAGASGDATALGGDDAPPAGRVHADHVDPVVPRFESAESFADERRERRHTGRPGERPDERLAGHADGERPDERLAGHAGRERPDAHLAELSTWGLLANVALTQGLFGFVLAAGAFYFEIPGGALGIEATPMAAGLPGVLVGVAFGTGLWLANEAAGALADAAGAGFDESLRAILAPDDLAGWGLLLGLVLPIVALVEEFVFRAAAIGAVAVGFGVSPWALAILSSVAFGVAHGAQGRAGMLVTGALGFALAGGFVETGSLLVVVVAHYVVNALEMVVHEGLGVERPLGSLGGSDRTP